MTVSLTRLFKTPAEPGADPSGSRTRYDVDLTLFERDAHNPSFASLVRSLRGPARDLVDFCVPCNPYFPTPGMFAGYAASLESILKYYPSDSEVIGRRLARTLGIEPESLVLANGSTELITWIDALYVGASLATPVPTFGRWTDQPAESGTQVHHFQLPAQDGFRFDPDAFVAFVRSTGARAAVICNPNNPTGGYLPRRRVLDMLDAFEDLDVVVVDESFIDFVDAEDAPSVGQAVQVRPNLVVLKSLGKNFGLHGVRCGYALAHPSVASHLRRSVPHWNVNALAESVVFSLAENLGAYRESLTRIAEDRRPMRVRLERIEGLTVYPSQANFFLVRLPDGVRGDQVRNRLLTHHGVFVRECGNKLGIAGRFLRFAVRPERDVDRLVAGLTEVLACSRQ